VPGHLGKHRGKTDQHHADAEKGRQRETAERAERQIPLE
jgi:hypothetical protein